MTSPEKHRNDVGSKLPETTTVLIVGGGPVGIMAAMSLSRLGHSCVILERHANRLGQPKAHVINTRSLEILSQNDVDLQALRNLGLPLEAHVARFVSSMSGVEFGAIDFNEFGHQPGSISSESLLNVAQPFLEEHLLQAALATGNATHLRMHEWRGCTENPDKTITSEVLILGTNTTRTIKSKYLIGCDGSSAMSRNTLKIPFEPLYGGDVSPKHYASVHFSADLSHHKPGLLWFVLDPTGMSIFIAYNRKNSWVYSIQYDSDITPRETFTSVHFRKLIFKVGDCKLHLFDSTLTLNKAVGETILDYKELSITLWKTLPKLAKDFRSKEISNGFLAGDAAHSFPPTGGLGLNTGIADVQNLAWKINAVEKGWAKESFLNTVSSERLVVAKDNCRQSGINEAKIFRLIDVICKPGATATSLYADPISRKEIRDAIDDNREHFDSTNLQLGYVYGRDYIRGPSDYQKEMISGARLPHCWIEYMGRKISSLSLIDGFTFVLITSSSFKASKGLDTNRIPVTVFQIKKDFEDVSGEFTGLLNQTGKTAILVRPDQHIVGTVNTIDEARILLISYLTSS
jgi:2,4-dichlorophenol 6-monooxygenase